MAFPRTFARCQFCETSDIMWKCINCDLLLCQLCSTRIHSKIGSIEDHQIINYKDVGTEDTIETIRKVSLKQMVCTNHWEESCCAYCNDCHRIICLDCLTSSHKNHKYSKLEHVYEEKIAIKKEMKVKIESDIPFLQEKENNLAQKLSEGNKQYDENLTKIREIKNEVNQYADKLCQNLYSQWNPTQVLIEKELSSVRNRKQDLVNRQRRLEMNFKSKRAEDMLESDHVLDCSMPNTNCQDVELKQRKFVPGKYSSKAIKDIVGSVYEIPDFKLVQTYQTNLYSINKLLICDQNSCFIGSFTEKLLQKVYLEEEHGIDMKITLPDLPVYDMAMMNNGDLLISTFESSLKLYSTDGLLKTFKSFPLSFTLGIYVKNENEILVGLSESKYISSPTIESAKRVANIDQAGEIHCTYEYDQHNQRLFTWPERIFTYNNNVYVIDLLNDTGKGRVVNIDKKGKLLWTYSGCNDQFNPRDIIETSTGEVLISDKHTIYILSPNGHLIVCKIVKDLGIEFPNSIKIANDGNLWVGSGMLSENQKAKIYAVEFNKYNTLNKINYRLILLPMYLIFKQERVRSLCKTTQLLAHMLRT